MKKIQRICKFAIALSFMGMAITTHAQEDDQPIGWPYRPEARENRLPLPQKPNPAQDENVKAKKAAPAYPEQSRSRPVDPNAVITPLEKILLPIDPLDFVYDDERVEIIGSEASKLRRLADRLRAGDERVTITAFSPDLPQDKKQGLKLALARALTVRAFLVREGVTLDRITLTALPSTSPGAPGGRLKVHPSNQSPNSH